MMACGIPATLPEARVHHNIPLDESPDARLLGCTWDRVAQSWWVDKDAVAGMPYVWRWMSEDDPMRKAARRAYLHLERQNKQALKSRCRRERKQANNRC